MVDVVLNRISGSNIIDLRGSSMDAVQLTDNRFFFVYFENTVLYGAIVDFTNFRTNDAYTITVQKSLAISNSIQGVKIEKLNANYVVIVVDDDVYLHEITANDIIQRDVEANRAGEGNTRAVSSTTNTSAPPTHKFIDILVTSETTFTVVSFASNTTSISTIRGYSFTRSNNNLSYTGLENMNASMQSDGDIGFKLSKYIFTNPNTSNQEYIIFTGPSGTINGLDDGYNDSFRYAGNNFSTRLATINPKAGALVFFEDRNQLVPIDSVTRRMISISTNFPGFSAGYTGAMYPDYQRANTASGSFIHDTLKLDNNYFLLLTYDTSLNSPPRWTAGYLLCKKIADDIIQQVPNNSEGFVFPDVNIGNTDLGYYWSRNTSFRKWDNTLVVFFGLPTTNGSSITFPIKRIAV